MGSDQGLRECLGRADCFFVFDRRERQIKHLRVIKGDLPIAAIERLESPIGGSVWVCAVTDCAGLSGRSLVLGKTRYTRLLDRFFLPDVPDPRVSVALFELCASVYDDIIERQRNIGTIRRLFELAAYHVARPNMKVLDFGCGTGLASDVLSVASLGPIRAMELYGTDASPAMLEHAKRRGMNTLSLGEWIALDGECFNVILAAYVLHYGVSDRDIRTICRQLTVPGVFVGNYHHATEEGLRVLARRFGSHDVKCNLVPASGMTEGPILLCTKEGPR